LTWKFRNSSTSADAIGRDFANYSFTSIRAGTYRIFEMQPDGFDDVGETVGTENGHVNGQMNGQDVIDSIVLGSGDQGISYNFLEIVSYSKN
jgi:hypothetical protein